ncbi:TPA: hypothetical protein ACNV18_000874 [Pseudomonas putida]|uniref:Uncharacterized protein n=1 Tax=Pseudomonas putida (strain DOT-T1E) TaxID=1196325 RepID=I7B123_PSEPT|nr:MULTISPECIES: hypothetical protein [Pseudomonas]AFO48730.1 hypothetical protein T1E_2891 [Pseudomonas putida DOT-T1E]PYB98288.1 hypothetical protein DMX12_16915 [Pseudomonas sp. MB-090624]UZM92219.1 hypothetical protein OPZ46_20435 [Pseudomonas putida DOT-T1E]
MPNSKELLKDYLKKSEVKLKEKLKTPVDIETIKQLFNVSLLRAIELMVTIGDYRGDDLYISVSSAAYLEYDLDFDTSNVLIDSCRHIDERRDYDYARAVTDYFFDTLISDYHYVEDSIAFLAMELPDYYIPRNDLPNFDAYTIAGLLKKALEMEDVEGWKYLTKKKAKEIEEFLKAF